MDSKLDWSFLTPVCQFESIDFLCIYLHVCCGSVLFKTFFSVGYVILVVISKVLKQFKSFETMFILLTEFFTVLTNKSISLGHFKVYIFNTSYFLMFINQQINCTIESTAYLYFPLKSDLHLEFLKYHLIYIYLLLI